MRVSVDQESLIDDLECVIMDTHDMDVTDRNYAINVVRFLEREGWLAESAEKARLVAKIEDLREALKSISEYTARCHDYDADAGHPFREFDAHDVRVLEQVARNALNQQEAEHE